MDDKNAWAYYRKAEACHALFDYAGAVRSSLKAKQLEFKSGGKFSKLSEKMKSVAREKLDELDMISLDMEIKAAEDLEESNKKEEVSVYRIHTHTIGSLCLLHTHTIG